MNFKDSILEGGVNRLLDKDLFLKRRPRKSRSSNSGTVSVNSNLATESVFKMDNKEGVLTLDDNARVAVSGSGGRSPASSAGFS